MAWWYPIDIGMQVLALGTGIGIAVAIDALAASIHHHCGVSLNLVLGPVWG